MNGNRLLRTLVVGLVVVLLVGAGGFGNTTAIQQDGDDDGTDEPVVNETSVRVIHVSSFLPSIDVFVEREPIATNVSFADATAYEAIEPGDNDFEVRLNESGEEIFESEATVEENSTYTLLAVGDVTENGTVQFQPVLLRDNYELPSEENASVRLVHASPDAPAVDVTIQGTNETLFENVSYRDDSPYVTVPAGNYTLEVRPSTPNGTGEVVATRNVSLEGGTVTTAFAAGFLDPEAAGVDFPFSVALVEDARIPSAAPETPTPGEVTESPEAPDEVTPTPGEATESPTPEAQTETPGEETETPEEAS